MSLPIRFGPFEVHLATGELRKNGRPIRIQEQPFQILAALLEHPGDVVSREQLRERLWPGDAYGDFDQSLNTAIAKLREALSDSPGDPKYIETLPKRGYRFTAPLALDPILPPQPAQPPQPRSRHLPLVAAGLVCAALGAIAGWILHSAPNASLPFRRWTILPEEPLLAYPFTPNLSISPDGRHIVGVASSSNNLWIHRLDEHSGRLIKGTEGSSTPFWSPDSSTIAFVANRTLMKIPVEGGASIRVAPLPLDGSSFGGAWSPDGDWMALAVGNPSQLYRLPAMGGNATPLLSREAALRASRLTPNAVPGYFWAPHFLPGGSRLAYSLGYLNPSVLIQDWKTGETEILDQGTRPVFAGPGYLLYTRSATYELWAQPLSPQGIKSGEPFRVVENCILPSVSRDQTLVCAEAPYEQLAWFDRQGKRLQLLGQPVQAIYFPALASDGRRVAMETLENGNLDIWVLDSTRGSRIRLTSHHATDNLPSWSPSGDEIAFSSYRSGSIDVWLRRADAGSEEILIHGTAAGERASDWSKDGKYILFSSVNGSQRDIHYLTRADNGKWVSHSFLSTPATEHIAKLSPDGRYAAYLSDESGRMELYVREFPSGGRKWAVSSHGAAQPRWSRDGKEIFYSENGTLLAVPVTTMPEFSAGPAARLFAHSAFGAREGEPQYDVSLDRQRILLPDPVGGNNTQIHVIQNWLSTFRK